MVMTLWNQIRTIFNLNLYNMVKTFRKMKGKMDKNLFGYQFVAMEIKHISENKVCLQSGNILVDI
jgi:hypothetical protein